MKCSKCGKEIDESSVYCSACGTKVKLSNEEVKEAHKLLGEVQYRILTIKYVTNLIPAMEMYQLLLLKFYDEWKKKPTILSRKNWERNIIEIIRAMFAVSCGKGDTEKYSEEWIMNPPKECTNISGWVLMIRSATGRVSQYLTDYFDGRNNDGLKLATITLDDIPKYLNNLWAEIESTRKKLEEQRDN